MRVWRDASALTAAAVAAAEAARGGMRDGHAAAAAAAAFSSMVAAWASSLLARRTCWRQKKSKYQKFSIHVLGVGASHGSDDERELLSSRGELVALFFGNKAFGGV
jgi:hypothetical protein